MTQEPVGNEAQRKALDRLNQWQSWCVFPVLFSAYLFWARPTSVKAAVAFRAALVLAGIIGYIACALQKRKIRDQNRI